MIEQRLADYIITFERIVELARQKKPNFLFISGDFLEHGYIDKITFERVQQALSLIPESKVFISPGNHDPYRSDSSYVLDSWPDNVHIFGTKWEYHYFAEFDLYICGRGFADFAERNVTYPDKIVDGRKILVVHGTLQKSQQTSDYFPILERDLLSLEFDYIAAGHIHKPATHIFKNNKKTLFRYPGSPEALSWKELGARTVTWGEMDETGVIRLTEFPVQSRSYASLICDISGIKSLSEASEIVAKKISEAELKPEDFIRINLTGKIIPELNKEILSKKNILDLLHQPNFKYITLNNQTELAFDIDYLRQRQGVVGLFIQKIEAEIIRLPEKKEVLQNALQIGLATLMSEE